MPPEKRRTDGRGFHRKVGSEESPGSAGHVAGESAGTGNREESATEMQTADGLLVSTGKGATVR